MDIQEIDKAIGAHGIWKTRLKQAIATGKLDVKPAEIKLKDHCPFGKWLHGSSLTDQDKTSQYYLKTVELHARFHLVAAKVAELAIAGKKVEAEKLLASGGEFLTISGNLTETLMNWKQSLTPTMAK
jgi:Chemoreceptor zinc-binding domain